MTRTRKILIGAAAVVASATGCGRQGVAVQQPAPAPSTTVAVPSTIASDCSTDVSVALNTFFASVPAGDTVTMPANGCYLVSNTYNPYSTPYPDLELVNLSNLTIDGNGTTLHQTSYVDNTCSTDDHQPVLQLKGDTGLTFNNLTIEGPNECGGAGTEGMPTSTSANRRRATRTSPSTASLWRTPQATGSTCIPSLAPAAASTPT